jgi:hypothetical protein
VTPLDPARLLWTERVAEAARQAAEELRALDDPTTSGLLADLDALHARLLADPVRGRVGRHALILRARSTR